MTIYTDAGTIRSATTPAGVLIADDIDASIVTSITEMGSLTEGFEYDDGDTVYSMASISSEDHYCVHVPHLTASFVEHFITDDSSVQPRWGSTLMRQARFLGDASVEQTNNPC